MKEKSSNLLEQIYVTPRIEVIALQEELPLMAGSKGKNPDINPGFEPGDENEEELIP